MEPLYVRHGLNTFEVHENPFIRPGTVASVGVVVYTRHLSEFLTAVVAGATVHYDSFRCPTWDDGVECRCMTESL